MRGERQGFHPHLRKIDNPNHLSVGVFSDGNDVLFHLCQEEESHVPAQAAVSSARPACELSHVSLKIIGLITFFFALKGPIWNQYHDQIVVTQSQWASHPLQLPAEFKVKSSFVAPKC